MTELKEAHERLRDAVVSVIETEQDWQPDQLYAEVMHRIAGDYSEMQVIDVVYDVCDTWHREGHFDRTDMVISLFLVAQNNHWLDSNDVSLSLLTITIPVASKLKNRKALYARMHEAYMTHRPTECEAILMGLNEDE